MPARLAQSIRVGTALSLSGRFAPQGKQAGLGLRLWAKDASRGGGLVIGGDRRPVQLCIYDDRSRSNRTAALFERLIVRDRVDLLAGPYGSGAALSAARVAERQGRLLWNHGGATTALDEIAPAWLVNVLSATPRYFAGLIELCREYGVGPRLALIRGSGGTFGRSVIEGARQRARELDFDPVFSDVYPSDDEDMRALAERAIEQRPDVLLGAGSADQDIAFARALLESGSCPAVVGLVATPIQRFASELVDAADGFFGPSQWEPDVDYTPDLGPTSQEFAARFQECFSTDPDYPAAQSYATGLIIQHCLARTGSLDESRLRSAAARADLTTFYGRFKLDPATGEQTGHQLVTIQRQNGRKRLVWPPEAAMASPGLPEN